MTIIINVGKEEDSNGSEASEVVDFALGVILNVTLTVAGAALLSWMFGSGFIVYNIAVVTGAVNGVIHSVENMITRSEQAFLAGSKEIIMNPDSVTDLSYMIEFGMTIVLHCLSKGGMGVMTLVPTVGPTLGFIASIVKPFKTVQNLIDPEHQYLQEGTIEPDVVSLSGAQHNDSVEGVAVECSNC